MGNKVGDKSMSKLMTTISRPIMVTLAILIIFVAAGCAHTYSPKQDLDIEWDSATNVNLGLGDIEEIKVEDWNQQYGTDISYDIFVIDFSSISTNSIPSTYSSKYPDVATILSLSLIHISEPTRLGMIS